MVYKEEKSSMIIDVACPFDTIPFFTVPSAPTTSGITTVFTDMPHSLYF